MREKILTLPNFLSLIRILIVLFFPVFLYKIQFALFILFLLVLTDFLDGAIARLLKEESKLGRILDHVIDKFVIAVIMLSLSFYRDFPLWGSLLVIIRDIISILIGYILMKKNVIMSSNVFGKTSGFFFALTTLSFLFEHSLRFLIFYITLLSFGIASLSYLYNAILNLRRVQSEKIL